MTIAFDRVAVKANRSEASVKGDARPEPQPGVRGVPVGVDQT